MGSSKRGVYSAKEAQRIAQQAHRKEAFKQAKQGKGPVPAYHEAPAAGGCLVALAALPLAAVRMWLR